MNFALRHTIAWLLPLVLFGCASHGGENQRKPARTAAILGVTIVPGVDPGRSQIAMSQEFKQLMQTEAGYAVLPSGSVKRALNIAVADSYKTMRDNYARSGALSSDDLKALQKAKLPVQTALIARIERNVVQQGAPKRVAIHNNAGHVLSDRERVVLSTRREMQIRATMLDAVSGRVVWSKSYRATPEAKSSYMHYSGSSFSGSLAASLANTMSNGLRVPSGPVPPSNLLTLRSLFREIVRQLPVN